MAGYPERSECAAPRRDWWKCLTVPSVPEVYLMPYGGKYQLTETQAMVAKLPVLKGKTDTVTMMSYGFDPYLSSWSPYHGAVYAVLESVSQHRGQQAEITARSGSPSRSISVRMTEDPQALESAFCSIFLVLTVHSLVSVFRLSVVKTVCPELSMRSMYRRHWFPLLWMWQVIRIS